MEILNLNYHDHLKEAHYPTIVIIKECAIYF